MTFTIIHLTTLKVIVPKALLICMLLYGKQHFMLLLPVYWPAHCHLMMSFGHNILFVFFYEQRGHAITLSCAYVGLLLFWHLCHLIWLPSHHMLLHYICMTINDNLPASSAFSILIAINDNLHPWPYCQQSPPLALMAIIKTSPPLTSRAKGQHWHY